jgi:pimeloyl-ACP methyl ester carboxylesterase
MSILKQPDVDLYYELSGQGPPVLLIQGWELLAKAGVHKVELLQHDFQTLIIDNRGIGKSAPCKSGITYRRNGGGCSSAYG